MAILVVMADAERVALATRRCIPGNALQTPKRSKRWSEIILGIL